MKKPSKEQVIIGIAIAGGALLFFGLYDKLFGKTDAEKAQAEADAAAKAAKDAELKKELKTSNLTRPESEYYTAANIIHDSLKFSSLDDNPDAAQRAFTTIINSSADLAFLKVVYGTRELNFFGISEGSFDLLATLAKEFSTSRKAETVTILAKKGVYINL